MFNDPNIYPCWENTVETAKAVWASIRGDQDAADRHAAAGEAAQQAALQRWNNRWYDATADDPAATAADEHPAEAGPAAVAERQPNNAAGDACDDADGW